MKKIFAIALFGTAVLTSCEKTAEQNAAEWASVAVIQAAPTSITVPSDTLQVFIDTMKYNNSMLRYLDSTGYMPVPAGDHKFDIKRGPGTGALFFNTTNYVPSFNYTVEKAKAYSFWVYDTTTSLTGTARVLKLKDDLSLPAANMAKVRFLHLAPKNGAVDVTFLRTSGTTPYDSVTISNISYVGAAPNEDALAAFTSIPRARYDVRVKAAGTQTVLATRTGQIIAGGINITEGRIRTYYLTGGAKSRALTVGSFTHF
jgi:hypothetical protein